MNMIQNITKNIFKAAVIPLLFLTMLTVVQPPAPSAAAPNDDKAKSADDKKADKKTVKPKDTSVQANGDQSDIEAGSLPTPDASQQTIKNILQILFGIIGAFAVLSITLSGLKYITSAGNEQKTAEAKNGIVYSLVGLAVAISAEAIVAFIITGAS